MLEVRLEDAEDVPDQRRRGRVYKADETECAKVQRLETAWTFWKLKKKNNLIENKALKRPLVQCIPGRNQIISL